MSGSPNIHAELTRRIAELEQNGGGTLELPDGVYGIDRTLRLPRTVSLCMTPHAVIRGQFLAPNHMPAERVSVRKRQGGIKRREHPRQETNMEIERLGRDY